MTQEDKELLLKDLCARLPHYPKCEMIDRLRVINNEPNPSYIETLYPKHIELFFYHNNFEIKPYLRPMSSMTEEEKEKYHSLCYEEEREEYEYGEWVTRVYYHDTIDSIDYLNSIHIDYRGLIEKSLAIEITEENNPYKD
jgi:hypothetical protein